MLAFGIVLLVLGGVATVRFLGLRRKLQAAQRAETLSCDDLGELAAAVPTGVEGVGFVKVCEVVGEAVPHDGGLLTAIESRQQCVWHRAVLTEHYWGRSTNSRGHTTRTRKRRQIHAQASETPFTVDDGTGPVAIDPRGAEFDSAEKVVDRLEEGMPTGAQLMWLAQPIFTAGNETIGVQHEEWIVRAGTRLYVLGQGRDDGIGGVTLRKPPDGPMIVSTRSEQDFAAATQRSMRTWLAGAVAGEALGIGLVVASFLV